MAEAGLLHRSADVRWARTIVWPTERGARIAGTGLSAPRPPGERLLHRLAVADAGVRLESEGRTVLSEREVHAAEAVPGRAAELLADLGAHQVPAGARRGETLAVPVGARTVHWPDLIVVLPGGRLAAFEVELTAKPAAALRTILRAYKQARRRWPTSPPSPSCASCRAAPARTAGGPTESPRSWTSCLRAGPTRAPADTSGYGRSPPSTRP
ncbi:hypothetical protein [Streptomyces sp. NPDC101115]|uniref:hypothetical protein n=1 Tax=Streptomyces sp. NPDC101115 TaxID=3366106 RepID=UPI0037FAB53B